MKKLHESAIEHKKSSSEPENQRFARRSFQEAADAGILLWRKNFFTFLPLFAIPFWIFAFSLRLLPGNLVYFSWLIIWLLKPLFDRIILHIVSIRFFDKNADLKRLRQGLCKNICRGLIGDLLWRRFSPVRSAMMPVRILERNIKSSKEITERKRLLEKGGLGYCFIITIWGIAVEIALLAGVIFCFFIINAQFFNYSYFFNNIENIEIYLYAIWCINYMLVETIYVCMGFSIYINSRIEVEGWDIEITFRNIAEKFKDKSKYTALIIITAVCLFFPVKNYALEETSIPVNDVPLETLQKILDSPAFGGRQENTWGIRLKIEPEPMDIPNIDSELLKMIQQIFSYFLLVIIISAAILLVIFLLLYLRKLNWKKSGKTSSIAEKTLHDKQAADPKLLLEKAAIFYKQGNTRLAWGFCTAAAIQSLSIYRGIIFPPNATENDCANIVSVKSKNDYETNNFKKLVKNWIYLAYAGKHPPEGSFEEAVGFCKVLRADNG